MAKTQHSDVIVIGGGLIGLAQGLALAEQGISVQIVDRADPAAMMAPGFDGRTSAISSSSYKMLAAIGLESALEGKGCPIGQIWVSDQLKPGAIDFVPGEEDGFLGQMFENRVLRRTIFEAVTNHPNIRLHMPADIIRKTRSSGSVEIVLDNGAVLTASLLIVAEGRQSQTREEAGIKIAQWTYNHSAMVGAVYHEKPHGNVAYEIFYPEGPFALLPMLDSEDGRHRSAIVWSASAAESAAYLKLGPRGYAHALEKAMGHIVGKVELAAPLSTYPLGFHHAGQVTAQRLVLIGDSAHGIHPIAGQGLNLGLRDVAALTEVLTDGMRLGLDPADTQLLERYSRWRSVDTLAVAMATDSLTRLFGLKSKTASAIRRFGMGAIQRAKPAKAFFMAEARGESGDMPKLLLGEAV